MPDVINWSNSAPKSNYVMYRFDDVIFNFTLSADDIGPQQDQKSWRTSHVRWYLMINDDFLQFSIKTYVVGTRCNCLAILHKNLCCGYSLELPCHSPLKPVL